MAAIGNGGTNIIRQLVGNVVNVFKKCAPCTSPCDGLILKMHYQWTLWLLLAGFSAVWYSWCRHDVITCESHFNAETQVRPDYINICLSYPYVEESSTERRFLLFYRWIHWTLLVLAGIYCIPQIISKNSENPKIKKLTEDLAVNSHQYDQIEKELVEQAAHFIANNLKTHNGLYYKFVICNVVALIVDIISFQLLDFVFQGHFLHYGWMAFPYIRDPVNFSDYMSRTFPPFVKCELGVVNKLVGQGTEKFSCHLTMMELYGKVFLVVWVWLIVLTTITCVYLIFLGFMSLPYYRQLMMLRVAKPLNAKDTVSNTIVSVVNCCKIGDIYILYHLEQHLSHACFYELLIHLSDPELIKTMLEDPADRAIHARYQGNFHYRKRNI